MAVRAARPTAAPAPASRSPRDHATPSAVAEKLLHRPSGDKPAQPAELHERALGVSISVAPPASASEHSPWRSAWQARCTVTSDDEHAVSTVMLGPLQPQHVADPPRRHARLRCPSRRSRRALRAPPAERAYSWYISPTNTPVSAAHQRARRQCPARSSASQLVSSSSRCCGSMLAASRGEIPKKPGSNWSISRQEPAPARGHLPGASGIGIVKRIDVPALARHLRRSRRCPSSSSRQNDSGSLTPPGKAAAHPHNRDRLVAGARRRQAQRRWSAPAAATRRTFSSRYWRDGAGRRVIEGQRRRQRRAHAACRARCAAPPPSASRAPAPSADGPGQCASRSQRQHPRNLGAHHLSDRLQPALRRQRRQLARPRPRGATAGSPRRLDQRPPQRRHRPRTPEPPSEGRVHRQKLRLGPRQRRLEQRDPLRGRQRPIPPVARRACCCLSNPDAKPAARMTHRTTDPRPGSDQASLRAPARRQRVEARIGRRIPALTRRAQRPRYRREQHEEVQSPLAASAHAGATPHPPWATSPAQTAPRSAPTAPRRPAPRPHAPPRAADAPPESPPAARALHPRPTRPPPPPSPARPAPQAPPPPRPLQASPGRDAPSAPGASSRARKPPRHMQTERPKPAGDEHRPLRPRRSRRSKSELADVPRLRHEPECRLCLRDREASAPAAACRCPAAKPSTMEASISAMRSARLPSDRRRGSARLDAMPPPPPPRGCPSFPFR